ncbi:poly-gamma-glutamate hydrolase family protein [Roseivivax sp. CAU 1753]
MADRFGSFDALAAALVRDVDYRIHAEDRGSSVVILAPHGGTIEPETSRIARTIAGSDLSFYAFEALNPGAHGDAHITSHRFDEPTAIALVGGALTAVAIHGRRNDGTDTVWLGGRGDGLRDAIGLSLRDAGFGAYVNATLPGRHPDNICNRTRSGGGVQLELPRSLRRALAAQSAVLHDFCTAVRTAIQSTVTD